MKRGVLALSLAVSACELVEPSFVQDDPIDPACEVQTADVGGSWKITGTGERFGCSDETFNTSFFELRSDPLVITQTGGVLELDPGTPPTFVFTDGTVMGRCVGFRTAEGTELGTLEFIWNGVVSEDGSFLAGQFTGQGPGPCEARGNFRINLR